MDHKAMFKIEYGLYVLTSQENGRDNGCIINVAALVSETPERIVIAVNKDSFTHDMVFNTGIFTISILTMEAPFETFKHFGFQSGRDVNKFEKYTAVQRGTNVIYYISENTNAYISGKVISMTHLGTHTLFVADVTDAQMLSEKQSVTYEYYIQHIKQPTKPTKKIGYVCKVCGYIYEGDVLPLDFICPWCKHGVVDFEKIEN